MSARSVEEARLVLSPQRGVAQQVAFSCDLIDKRTGGPLRMRVDC
jgi:hypothetical protein